MFSFYRQSGRFVGAVVAIGCLVALWFGPLSAVLADDPPLSPSDAQATTDSASLHNPGFDNHDWYFFHERYDASYPDGPDGSGKPFVPDDDNNTNNNIPADRLQDWRLWYMRGTPLVQTFAESQIVDSVESVAIRTYNGNVHQGGLYQVVYNTTPCMYYQFDMKVRSQPDPGDNPAAALQVGIDRVGWHPDSKYDPAVPGAFPETTVWGEAKDYKRTFGTVSVTAEAWADHIAVYAYANASGGRRHAIVWDTGSFQQVAPESLADPDNLPSPNGTTGVSAFAGRDWVRVNWTTYSDGMSQVFYRLTPESPGSVIMPPNYPYKVYLPMISGTAEIDTEWQSSAVDTTSTKSHQVDITNLLPGRTYQYVVVSRGASGSECVNWVSAIQTFTTNE